MTNYKSNAVLVDKIATIVLYIISGFFILLIFSLCAYIIINGFMVYKPGFLSFSKDGIGNELFNTIYLVFISLLVSAPLGIATGIYLAEYAKQNKLTSVIRTCIQTLSSLPSVVLGLFGVMMFIEVMGFSTSLFVGGMTVSILNLPLIANTTEDAFKSLPKTYKKGSMCLGATHFQTIIKVLLPACLPRILTGVILSAGRGFGEAAALLFTAGMSTTIRWEYWCYISEPTCPFNPFRSGGTLALKIWGLKSEALNPNAEDLASFASAILIVLVLGFSLLARWLSSYLDKKNLGLIKEKNLK